MNTKTRQVLILFVWLGCCLYAGRVLWQSALAETNGFAAYYTAARLLAYSPAEMPRIYENDWFAAQIERAGIHGVYDIFNIQPPTMSLLLLPLARLIWTLLGLFIMSRGLLHLGRALNAPASWALAFTPLCFLYTPVAENFCNGQAYACLFFLVCLFFWAVLRPAQGLAGLALGLMAVLKTAAAWLWPLLLLKGQWRVLSWAVGVIAAVILTSLPWIGLETWRNFLALLPQLAADPKRYVTAYQTVTSLAGHLFIYDAQWNPAPLARLPLLGRGLPLLALLAGLFVSLRWGPLDASQPEKRCLTLAMFLALAVPNAPVAEGYHYMLLLPSVLAAAWWAWHTRLGWPAWLALILAVLMLGAPLPYRSPRLSAGVWALLAYPRLYGANALWLWLLWAIRLDSQKADSLAAQGETWK